MYLSNSKKGIVLLITLFFISAISLLILQNLKDSENFFKIINTNTSLTQTQISIKNVNDEIMGFFKKNKDDIDDILEKLPPTIPLELNDDLHININLEQYFIEDYIMIDDLNSTNTTEEFNLNVDYKYTFFEILNKNKKLLNGGKFTNQKQINSIIDEYIKETKDRRILEIKDKFNYGSFDNNDSSVYLNCNYELDISDIKSFVNMVFKVGETNTTKFEFYFGSSYE